MSASIVPSGPRPQPFNLARLGVYAFLIFASAFFLIPLWVTMVTSLKSMDEIRLGHIMALPSAPTFEPWIQAWSSASTGLAHTGIQPGFVNSLYILIPSVIASIAVGALTGYAMTFYKVRGANALFVILLIGAFIPYQVFLYPLIRVLLGDRHLWIARRHRRDPRRFRLAANDIAVPQLL